MPRIVPKLSASLLIVDTSDGEPRFLFGRRHASHKFMPNRYVFPGGRVDAADARLQTASQIHAFDQAVIEKSLKGRDKRKGANAVAFCAIREAFEEAGHMFGVSAEFRASNPQWDAFSKYALAPDLSALRLVARAITPAYYPRRYDAWFFMAFRKAIARSVDVCGPDSELDHQIWASEAETQGFNLPSITRMVLREAVERLKLDPELTRDEPVPMFATRAETTRRVMLTP